MKIVDKLAIAIFGSSIIALCTENSVLWVSYVACFTWGFVSNIIVDNLPKYNCFNQ